MEDLINKLGKLMEDLEYGDITRNQTVEILDQSIIDLQSMTEEGDEPSQ